MIDPDDDAPSVERLAAVPLADLLLIGARADEPQAVSSAGAKLEPHERGTFQDFGDVLTRRIVETYKRRLNAWADERPKRPADAAVIARAADLTEKMARAVVELDALLASIDDECAMSNWSVPDRCLDATLYALLTELRHSVDDLQLAARGELADIKLGLRDDVEVRHVA
ncbi:MAG: hypothetical protein QM770_07990 [Tepidisphaeraceae bacterium]